MELSKEQLLSSAKYLRELAETAHPLEGREYLAKAELAETWQTNIHRSQCRS